MAEHDDAGITPEVWRAIVDLGWTGVLVPEECGGLGLGIVDAVVVQEEMGRGVFPGPVLLVGDPRDARGARARARRSARRRSPAGRERGTVALDEAGSGESARSRARARRRARHPLQARRREADGDGRRHRRLGARARADARRAADVPRRAARARTLAPSLDITRKFARLEFDGTRGDAVGPAGDQTRSVAARARRRRGAARGRADRRVAKPRTRSRSTTRRRASCSTSRCRSSR